MSLQRFRDGREMPRPARLQGEALLEALRELGEGVGGFELMTVPRGVRRFRTMEEAHEARRILQLEHMRRLRDRRG